MVHILIFCLVMENLKIKRRFTFQGGVWTPLILNSLWEFLDKTCSIQVNPRVNHKKICRNIWLNWRNNESFWQKTTCTFVRTRILTNDSSTISNTYLRVKVALTFQVLQFALLLRCIAVLVFTSFLKVVTCQNKWRHYKK